MRDHCYWVYIVTNRHHHVFYIGMTNDLLRRVDEHRQGEVPGFTQTYRVAKLIYYEHYSDVRDAIIREKQLKNWTRAKKIVLIERLNPSWQDLAIDLEP